MRKVIRTVIATILVEIAKICLRLAWKVFGVG